MGFDRVPGTAPPREKQGHYTFNQSEPLAFGTPNPIYNAATAITGTHWRTPVYDLRYNLGDVDGFGQRRQKNIEQDVLLGIDFNLFVSLNLTFSGTAAAQFLAFKWYMMEFGNPMDPNKPFYFQTRQDVTSQVYSGYLPAATQVDTTLVWRPTGPIRYWGVVLICDQVLATDITGAAITAPPKVLVTAALH